MRKGNDGFINVIPYLVLQYFRFKHELKCGVPHCSLLNYRSGRRNCGTLAA